MIEQIIKTMELHELDSIAVFCSKKYSLQGLCAAIALVKYLRLLGLPSYIITNCDIGITNELFVQKPTTKHFLAIAVDCKKTTSIDSQEYEDSNILAQVYAPMTGKGFGVLNFIDTTYSCTTELLHRQLHEYCKKHNSTLPIDIDLLLYLSYEFTAQFYQNHRKIYQYPIEEIIKTAHDSPEMNKFLKAIDDILANMTLREDYILINLNSNKQMAYDKLFLEIFNELTDMIPFILCSNGIKNSEVLIFANECILNRLDMQIASITTAKNHKTIRCMIDSRKKDRFIKQIAKMMKEV